MNLDNLKGLVKGLKDKVTKTAFERLLSEATSNENWPVSNTTLQEIADHTYNHTDFITIMKHIWKKLSATKKKWRKIMKTLNLIEYLLKNASPKVIGEIKDELY